jgi:hypothetical protein
MLELHHCVKSIQKVRLCIKDTVLIVQNEWRDGRRPTKLVLMVPYVDTEEE